MASEVELRNTGFNKKELSTQIEIDADSERVWRVLTDFASFSDWNPFMRINGEPSVGKKLNVHVQPSGARGMTFKPTVLTVQPNQEIRWIGHLFIPGLFDGEHILEIQPIEGSERVRFVQRELFSGLLLPLLSRTLKNTTGRAFAEMNRALKDRVERAPQQLQ